VHLAEAVAAWPVGPLIAPSPAAFAPEVRLLASAGLSRDALAALTMPKDDAARCAIDEQFDDGWDAYKIGQQLKADAAPDAANAWKWRCGWPSPYAPLVAALEAREGLPRGLMHAILRQESAFRVEVVSPAGAVGIAQLMPATAQQTAAPLGITLDETDIAALQAPYLQLDLASRHLHALFVELAGEGATEERKRDVVPLVVAAYNAGACSVKRWLKESPGMEADVFIERTPYLETRGYVARVLGNMVRYAVINGAPTPTLPRTFPAPPP
jgi:soluble lytic murein transglycosylase